MIDLIGGPDRDRTDDLFHAMEARSQTAPQAHVLGGCNLSIVSAAAGQVKPKARAMREAPVLSKSKDEPEGNEG